jgi:pimeloyl-ACP methyl ester carboxylesterase
MAAVDTAPSDGDSVQRTVRSPDGRALAVEESGDPDGRPVLVHMGTPAPRRLYGPHVRDAAARGLRLISYDRPGYGGSSPQPGRSVADCAGDVRTICADSASSGWQLGVSLAAARTSSRVLPCFRIW